MAPVSRPVAMGVALLVALLPGAVVGQFDFSACTPLLAAAPALVPCNLQPGPAEGEEITAVEGEAAAV